MSDTCLNCKGLIMETNKTYGYAGPICHCQINPALIFQRPASKEQSAPLPADVEKLRDELAQAYVGNQEHPTAKAVKLGYEVGFDACAEKLYKPALADVEYLTKQLEIADGNLADCERNLEESIADNDKAEERIAALEAVAERMAEQLESARSTAVTHAMQTYSKVSAEQVKSIDEILETYRGMK